MLWLLAEVVEVQEADLLVLQVSQVLVEVQVVLERLKCQVIHTQIVH